MGGEQKAGDRVAVVTTQRRRKQVEGQGLYKETRIGSLTGPLKKVGGVQSVYSVDGKEERRNDGRKEGVES